MTSEIIDVVGLTFEEAALLSLDRLIEQGKQCTDGYGHCFYSCEKSHCAVGWFLPDGYGFSGALDALLTYDSNLRCGDPSKLPEPLWQWLDNNKEQLSILQKVHDFADSPGQVLLLIVDWSDELRAKCHQWFTKINGPGWEKTSAVVASSIIEHAIKGKTGKALELLDGQMALQSAGFIWRLKDLAKHVYSRLDREFRFAVIERFQRYVATNTVTPPLAAVIDRLISKLEYPNLIED